MGFFCDCIGDFEEFVEGGEHFERMQPRKRRKRCYSCCEVINAGDFVLEFKHYRVPRCDIEERIHGDHVPLAPLFICEACGEIYLNLEAAGLCVSLDGDLRDDLRTYWEMTGFDPSKYADSNLPGPVVGKHTKTAAAR